MCGTLPSVRLRAATLRRRALASTRDERGITLAFTLGVLVVLTILGTTVTYYATSNFHQSQVSKSSATAYGLAEAAMNDALSKAYAQLDTDGSVLPGGIDPRSTSLLSPATTIQYPNLHGTATYSGTLDASYNWTITAVGKIVNSGQTQTRKITKSLKVVGLNDGSDGIAWSRFYQDDASKCLTIDTVVWPASVSTRGDLCLKNGATVTGSTTNVNVGGDVIVTGPNTSVGPSAPTLGANSGASNVWSSPTSIYTSDNVYATATVATGANSAALNATAFGFNIPSTALVNGVTVTVERKGPATASVFKDNTLKLLKAGTAVGTSQASASYWPTTDGAATYGSATNLWGTTLTPADVNSSAFGVQLTVHNYNGASQTASVDYISVKIDYTNDTQAIGASGSNVQEVNVEGSCKYNGQTAHTPCGTSDRVYSGTVGTVGKDLSMPDVDYAYWWANAKPGPKYPCTSHTGTPPTFDNDGATTSAPNQSLNAGGAGNYVEIAPPGQSYTCQVVENGATVGELSWNSSTHVLTIKGTIFVDGDFRFDADGEIVHYNGRADIFSSGNDEIDAMVCAGGSGTTSCATNMSGWNPSQNMLVLLSMENNEYDQGGTTCSPYPTATCLGGHPVSGFQGVLYSKGDCLIHENFKDSGPVVCNSITLPLEPDGFPTYFPYPALTNLTNGQKYSNTATATNFELDQGTQTG